MARTRKTETLTPEIAVEEAAEAIGAIAERGRSFYENALRTWGEEGHTFLETMAKDGASAFEQLQKCKSPFEALSVEQAWLLARSKAYMEAGRRMFEAGAKTARDVANEAPGFRLPE
jgi:hypothetical protein